MTMYSTGASRIRLMAESAHTRCLRTPEAVTDLVRDGVPAALTTDAGISVITAIHGAAELGLFSIVLEVGDIVGHNVAPALRTMDFKVDVEEIKYVNTPWTSSCI